MEMFVKNFVKKYHDQKLDDDGSHVSRQFKAFQTSFVNVMGKYAKSIGGELVNASKGHYDISGFIKKDGKFVYFHYSNSLSRGGRSHVNLCGNGGSFVKPMYVRTADSERDYYGGANIHVNFTDCFRVIRNLLE